MYSYCNYYKGELKRDRSPPGHKTVYTLLVKDKFRNDNDLCHC
jgi:hypothetical protein